IPSHVGRTIGSMRITTTWARNFPYYAPGPDGTPEYRGTMTTGRPWTARAYKWLSREPLLKFLRIDIPRKDRDSHRAFTARVIAEAKHRWEQAVGPSRFVVVI